jgi:L-asparaginase II
MSGIDRLVNVWRGDEIESYHSGSIAVVDAFGRLVAYTGDPSVRTFLRSAAKPFQILPLLREGGRERFELTDEEIALICASHGGETHHVATAAALLRKGEFDESDLRCGAHMPFDDRAASEIRQSGESPGPLHNNCSGKHAGMLLFCELLDLPSETYLQKDHPLQIDILNTMSDFSGVDPDEIGIAVDGCGVPTFSLPLYRAALAFARLAATSLGMDEPASIPDYTDHARHVVTAMTTCPAYVAGSWSVTTPLIDAFDSELLAKEGAEGFYAMAVFPAAGRAGEMPGLFEHGPLGVAIKIADGSMSRGRDPVIFETLRQLGLKPLEKPGLQSCAKPVVKNVAGNVVGRLEPVFSLTFL